MNKFAVVSNSEKYAIEIKNELKKNQQIEEIDIDSDIKKFKDLSAIIVVGGDGTMLHTIHNYKDLKLPFYGINAGSLGFLMNEYKDGDEIIKRIELSEKFDLNLLSMKCFDIEGNKHETIAFNEVYIYRSSNQAIKLKLYIDKKLQLSELVGDGVIVSTPAGSSAYNFSAGGRIVPLESNVLCITPICAFRPKRWHGAIIPDESVVEIEILDFDKRKANAVADFKEIKNITKIEIFKNNNESIKILFDKDSAFRERIIKEQFLL